MTSTATKSEYNESMTWPDNLNSVHLINMNFTELWILKELIEADSYVACKISPNMEQVVGTLKTLDGQLYKLRGRERIRDYRGNTRASLGLEDTQNWVSVIHSVEKLNE